jgi:hypothetical protein
MAFLMNMARWTGYSSARLADPADTHLTMGVHASGNLRWGSPLRDLAWPRRVEWTLAKALSAGLHSSAAHRVAVSFPRTARLLDQELSTPSADVYQLADFAKYPPSVFGKADEFRSTSSSRMAS